MTAPDAVSVPEGLCVFISCSFTYDPGDARISATLYGYWYEVGKTTNDPAVATNNDKKDIADFALNRFHLSEDLEGGNCSLTINDAQKRDRGNYYFRMEKEPKAKFDYKRLGQPSVSVTTLENPEIQILGKLRAGHPVNITCTTPGSCALKPPIITWEGISEKARSRISDLQPNGTKVYSTVFNFVPSVADHGQNLTCSVRYGNETSFVYRAETIQLDINYPPEKLEIHAELLRSNKIVKKFTGVTHFTVNEGDSIVLQFEVKGNPSPTVTWMKKSQSEWTPLQPTSGNTLKISDLKKSHMGEYKCEARNPEGSSKATFKLSLEDSPRACKQEISHCKQDSSGFQCKCSICSSPSPNITWQVNGETLAGNTTQGKIQVTTWNTEKVGTSTLRFTGDWDGEHHFTCHGVNPKGELDMMFFPFSSGDMLITKIVSAVIGALIMFVIMMLIIAIIVTSKKCKRKSVTASKSYTKQLVQGEIPIDVKGSSIKGGDEVPKVQEKSNESTVENADDAEDLHYATLEFKLKESIPETIPEEPQTEYAEIKTS
ncbi:sialic acid-binding Ig-like lectin 14 [Elgaria multicarinata webbii]|uniref:sialic acid-binding Ig-like lectin 14 n=1 Tax=Elgaria multicarinata webbii TaxID=159646 RepID=UPI002FCD661F